MVKISTITANRISVCSDRNRPEPFAMHRNRSQLTGTVRNVRNRPEPFAIIRNVGNRSQCPGTFGMDGNFRNGRELSERFGTVPNFPNGPELSERTGTFRTVQKVPNLSEISKALKFRTFQKFPTRCSVVCRNRQIFNKSALYGKGECSSLEECFDKTY